MLEEDRGVVGIDLLVLGQLGDIHIYGSNLPAGDREAARIFGNAERSSEPSRLRLADMTGHTGNFRIVECGDANLVIFADQAEGRTQA